jgi:hypothetical protein
MTTDTYPEPPLYQVAYVTTDVDRAIDVLQDMRGIPLQDLGVVTLPLDDGAEVEIRLAMGFLREVMFELIEPVGGSTAIYTEKLPAAGFGIEFHHLAYKVASPEHLDVIRGRLNAAGHPIAMSGGRVERARFIYADFRAELGHYVEYLYLSAERQAFQNALPRAV